MEDRTFNLPLLRLSLMSKLIFKNRTGTIGVAVQDSFSWASLKFEMDQALENDVVAEFKKILLEKRVPKFPMLGLFYLVLGIFLTGSLVYFELEMKGILFPR